MIWVAKSKQKNTQVGEQAHRLTIPIYQPCKMPSKIFKLFFLQFLIDCLFVIIFHNLFIFVGRTTWTEHPLMELYEETHIMKFVDNKVSFFFFFSF